MLSFILPAHNEEFYLGRTLRQVFASARALGEPFEVIVVDDASTDRTAEVARSHGASVRRVSYRNIAAVRNAGARAAGGNILVFLDADTLLPQATLRALLRALRHGAAAGGARVAFDGGIGLVPQVLLRVFSVFWNQTGWAAGCFLFARRDAFEAAGGFDERYFATEEVHLSRALKNHGRFVILREPVVTSLRKFRLYPLRQLIAMSIRLLLGGRERFRHRRHLGILYDAPRETAAEG
ncbi:MAG: glycosyltransferase [Planctomycetes bacterium]|nr:glycosyltransferase [Planctomycetota bacterium]